MSKRVNNKKGNRVRKFKRGPASHCTKVRGQGSSAWFTRTAESEGKLPGTGFAN